MNFLSDIITPELIEAAASKTYKEKRQIDKTPVPQGQYDMTVMSLKLKESKAGNVYLTARLRHAGEGFENRGDVFCRIMNSQGGLKKLAGLLLSTGKFTAEEIAGLRWDSGETPDEYGNFDALLVNAEGADVTPLVVDSLVRAFLVVEEDENGEFPPKNDVGCFLVREA
jgi:hypothetical protein